MSKKRKEEKQKASTRKLIGIKDIGEASLITYDQGELVYFLVKPTNISVLSEESISARIDTEVAEIIDKQYKRCLD